ncbi:MAG: ComEC/Rec2 family competence protein, partial [Bacilli bacterium]
FKNIINSYQNYFKKIWIISFIAFLTSIPIMINNFFMINLLSPFLNLIFVPMISLIIFPLAVLTFFLPSLDNLLFSLITILEQLSLFFKQITLFNITLAKIPFVLLVIYYIIITFCLYNYLHKQYLIILIIVIFIHSRLAYFNNNYEIISLDVGQGDSTLIKFPHNDMNILIDTGGNMFKTNKTIIKNTTIPYLKSLGITKLNYLFLTHGDYDHMGESRELIKNFPVKYVFMNKGNNNKIEKKFIKLLDFNHIKYEQISKKNIEIDNDQIMFINKSNSKNENEDSLITYMNLNNKNILLMGDASKNNEKYILKEYNLPNMDILKIGHHGSKNSTSKQLLKKVKPQYAIISVGLNNHYYHPHKKVIALLKKHKVIIYKTSTQGSIKFILKKNIKVITCRHGAR